MHISIQIRNVYGCNKAYPACDSARVFAEIAGTKTFTLDTLRRVLRLGFDIEVLGATEYMISHTTCTVAGRGVAGLNQLQLAA